MNFVYIRYFYFILYFSIILFSIFISDLYIIKNIRKIYINQYWFIKIYKNQSNFDNVSQNSYFISNQLKWENFLIETKIIKKKYI